MVQIGIIDRLNHPAISSTFHTLVLQPTTFCNLDCDYCYLQERGQRRLMTPSVATACAESIAAQGSRYAVDVVWHGGEPTTTPIELFRKLLAPFEDLRLRGLVQHQIQTNGTLINSRWCQVFHDYDFTIGVSIDGPHWNNQNRLDRAGNQTYTRTSRGMRTLVEHGLSFSAICVVSPETIDNADELLDFFSNLNGCESVGFNLEEQEGSGRPALSEQSAYKFWRRLVERRLAGNTLRIRDLDRLAGFIAARRAGNNGHAPYDPIPTVSCEGDTVLLSPELLGVPSEKYSNFSAGNVLRTPVGEIIANAPTLPYVTEFITALNGCANTCYYFDFCKGAQAGNRYFEYGTFDVPETNYCRTTRQALVRATVNQLHASKEGGKHGKPVDAPDRR